MLSFFVYCLSSCVAFCPGACALQAMAGTQQQAIALVAFGIRHPWLTPRRPGFIQADLLQPLFRRPLRPLYRNVTSSKWITTLA